MKKFSLVLIGYAIFVVPELAWVKENPIQLQVSSAPSALYQEKPEKMEKAQNLINESKPTMLAFYKEMPKPFWDISFESNELGLSPLQEINDIEQESSPHLTKSLADKILTDYQNRVNPEFRVPEMIFNQTKFWFRIYTEFDSNKKIIHDALHPHIILDVIDISPILAKPAKAQWLNVEKANKMVKNRIQEVRRQLMSLARKPKHKMTAEELGWYSQFETIQGNKRRIIERAAQSLRVQTGQKDFYQKALYTSGFYLKGIEETFIRKKMPRELARLPFVESSFVIGATSKVGAAGIWQIMPGVGRKFLTINDQIDERRNPWKSTETAARLLKENHLILHKKWGLALTAYNHGPGGVRRAIEATGSKDIAKIVRQFRSKNFDFASANFYTCFLAAMLAEKYSDKLWPEFNRGDSMPVDYIVLKKPTRVKKLMELVDLDKSLFLRFNPELDKALKYNLTIPKGHRLMIPSDSKGLFLTIAEANARSNEILSKSL